MIEKEFVPYEEALSLKELGFDEPCLKYKWNDEKSAKWMSQTSRPTCFHKQNLWTENDLFTISIPTFSQAFRWFRDKYKLHYPIAVSDGVWFYAKWSLGGYKTYEEAELACLRKLIEIANGK